MSCAIRGSRRAAPIAIGVIALIAVGRSRSVRTTSRGNGILSSSDSHETRSLRAKGSK
jgi:hypothetical protein